MLDIEEFLSDFMEDEFSVLLEDESPAQIAALVHDMAMKCIAGDYQLAREMVTFALNSPEFGKVIVTDGGCDINDDMEGSDDDMAMEDGMSMEQVVDPMTAFRNQLASNSETRDFGSSTLFASNEQPVVSNEPVRQLGEAAPVKEAPVLDEDGFAPVKKKGNRKKNAMN